MKIPLTIVIIEWIDANIEHDSEYENNLGALTKIISCGILVKETDKVVVIAQENHFEDYQYRDSTTIPKVNIITRKQIKTFINVKQLEYA